jgi:hypothetical protein
MGSDNKKPSKRHYTGALSSKGIWKVRYGYLKGGPGNPGKTGNLFQFVAEKIPFEFLYDLRSKVVEYEVTGTGVYIAHDSMGWPRYIGRGNVFSRLEKIWKAHRSELYFFSIYGIEGKKHSREVETVLIRTAGSLLSFNTRKKRHDTATGWVSDYEVGTEFAQRVSKKGKPVAVGMD